MDLTMSLFIICPFVFIAGVVDAIAGGGGLISMPAYLLTGMPVHVAYGCNKFSAGSGSAFSAYKFLKSGALDLKLALISSITTIIGARIATKIVFYLSDAILNRLLLFLLPAFAVFMLLKKMPEQVKPKNYSKNKIVFLALLIGFFIGFYDGFFGPGTGTLCIFAYTMILGIDMKTASGNAKIINLVSNIASLVTYILSGTILFSIAVPAAVCGIAGNWCGSSLAIKKGARCIQPMMRFVVIMLLGKTILSFL